MSKSMSAQRRPVDIVLAAGTIRRPLRSQADSVAVDLITPPSSNEINGDQVRELPINNRNFVQFVALAPGVSNDLVRPVYVGTTNPDGQANTIKLSVNGARSSSEHIYGRRRRYYRPWFESSRFRRIRVSIRSANFKVLRSLYPAESGRSGGGQVNIVTRSGTDKFHGPAFEFVRNRKFNANDFLTNASSTRRADEKFNGKARRCPLRYNNFGFTIGGPIYFLKFGEKDPGDPYFGKMTGTYFFFSEEQRRALQYSTFLPTVPDAAVRQGIFPVDVCINPNNVVGSACTGANILTAVPRLPAGLIVEPDRCCVSDSDL